MTGPATRRWRPSPLNAEKAIFKQADLAPTMSLTIPTFAKGAKFGLGADGISPTTLRLTKKK